MVRTRLVFAKTVTYVFVIMLLANSNILLVFPSSTTVRYHIASNFCCLDYYLTYRTADFLQGHNLCGLCEMLLAC